MGPLINIHALIPSSVVNGPGRRMVVFFQGCTILCRDCFNPDTHSLESKRLLSSDDIFSNCFEEGLEGITVSGGEPFLQLEGLFSLLKAAKTEYGLSTVVYSGFSLRKLKGREDVKDIFKFVDVLIDGPFDGSKKETTTLARGSSNQNVHFLSDRYKMDDFFMPARIEITIGRDGRITGTGFKRLSGLRQNCI